MTSVISGSQSKDGLDDLSAPEDYAIVDDLGDEDNNNSNASPVLIGETGESFVSCWLVGVLLLCL